MFYPYGNPNSNETLLWGSEPRYRGTYSILSSCIITIALCVWTVVHLNVPEYGKVMPQFWRKVFWMLVGLLAPELVAWTAYQQLQAAKMIRDDTRRMSGHPPILSIISRVCRKIVLHLRIMSKPSQGSLDHVDLESTGSQQLRRIRRQPWTLTHGHYVAMGGFAVDVSDVPYIFPPDHTTRRFILPRGFELLLQWRPDLIPDLSEREIKDKSKADGLAKTLVCLQALWFCTQIIARVASRLTISILELNTFAHALCTLIIFLLWWDKPLDITEPTIVRGEAANPYIALLSVLEDDIESTASVIFRAAPEDELDTEHRLKIEKRAVRVAMDIYNTVELQRNHLRPSLSREELGAREFYEANVPVPEGSIRLWLGDIFPSTEFATTYRYLDRSRIPDDSFVVVDLPSNTADRFQLAWGAFRQLQSERKPAFGDFRKKLTDRVRNSSYALDILEGFWPFFIGITIAGMVYGGLHLTAWGAPMSQPARTLWRCSSIIVVSTGALWLPMHAHFELKRKWSKGSGSSGDILPFLERLEGDMYYRFVRAYFAVVSVVYVAARIFLVVECFLNVRHLPASSFEVPQWSQYFPHIS